MNKTMIAGSPGTSFIPTYNTSNHYATLPAGTPSYDNNGNLLNDSFHTYSWDNEGNPVTIDSYSLTYDALDRRVKYGTGSSFTQYLYAPFDPTLNLGAAAALASPGLRIPTPGGGRAILGASGITDYRRPNWQQSEPIDSSTSGTAISDASYTAYGEHYQENGYSGFFAANLSIYPVFTDGYAATWRLYHYDQNRWISPDPAGLSAVDPSDPQTWNRYAYARGNPLDTTDPSGLCSDYDPSCADFSVTVHACPNWWNIWCWATGGNGTSPLPPSQYQAFNAGVNPNSGNPGAPGFTGQGGGSAPSNPAPNQITCGTVLPNGWTVGSYVNQLSNTINNSTQSTSTLYGPSASYSPGYSPLSISGQVYTQTNFKIMLRGQGNAALLGDAGNVAYAAVSANICVPLFAVEGAAGLYARWAGQEDTSGFWGMDASARTQIPAGYGASCRGF